MPPHLAVYESTAVVIFPVLNEISAGAYFTLLLSSDIATLNICFVDIILLTPTIFPRFSPFLVFPT